MQAEFNYLQTEFKQEPVINTSVHFQKHWGISSYLLQTNRCKLLFLIQRMEPQAA